ncbi:hypothetical protein RvY_15346 [Ramazzottius varieornatus]|uniref:DNA polymerase delta subunit 3 n=1 Tax=Ramazzottius varieornatus TaxID=947166 RepID=A0A1D1VW73_RAMVA|nr:hypothetical protein RvY_15346 [Ramazzottius varieornatus]
MVKASDAALLKQLIAMVEDDLSIVTYKTLSRRLELSVNHAKRLLDSYASSPRRPSSVSVVYALFGSITLDDGTTWKVIVAPESEIEERSRSLNNVSKHVYSIHAAQLGDSTLLHMADHPVGPDDVRNIQVSTSIDCCHIGPRQKTSQEHQSKIVSVPNITGQTLKKIENDESKVMAGLGTSITALKVKPKTESAVEPPRPQETKVKSGTVASWVKAGGLDPKKPSEIQKAVESNRRRALSPINKKKKETNSDSEDDFFAPKRNSRKSAKALLDSDEEDVGWVEKKVEDMEDVEMGEQSINFGQDEMEKERSPSPDQPTVIRRSGVEIPTSKPKNEVSIDKSSSRTPKASRSTFGGFTQVSDTEEIEEEIPRKKSAVKSDKDTKSNFVESDEEMKEVEKVVEKPAKKSNKKAQPKEGESDRGEEGKRPTRKPRKRAKKESDAGNIYSEERQRSPSVEKPDPLEQFLQTSHQQKERKLVTRTRVDDEGYTVMEKVWVNASDEEAEHDAKSVPPVAPPTPKSPKKPSGEKISPPKKEVPAASSGKGKSKNGDTGSQAGKGKTVQSSLMNFFKKA